jgi:hypothetical protein
MCAHVVCPKDSEGALLQLPTHAQPEDVAADLRLGADPRAETVAHPTQHDAHFGHHTQKTP